jgi:DNA anti-recombination protein RmuC
MSVPPRLAVKLDEVLGHEAAEDFVTWLDSIRADINELRQEILRVELRLADRIDARIGSAQRAADEKHDALEKSVGAFENAMQERFATVDKTMLERFATVDKTMQERFATMDKTMLERFATVDKAILELRVELTAQHASLLKWSFLFWVGAVAAIATLAGVLRG